ncbi:TadE family type IV pilus minor pilin [Microbacterium sp. RG1]|uniref:TadE family type IV pilus minor pilin n=1 Tax=Microbacterium sp. RG1 TaxID=2489212 RepID=UPI0010CA56E1|nr:TadE family type IV pilus minor pilin [Microbacterium sp. RG1]QCQ16706.1 hypothetical protein EHF32_08245 [Microbacterium sp. RG1]
MRSRLGDRGSAAAEFAVAVPAVLLVLILGIGGLATASAQVRLQDAVADAARLAARGEDAARALAALTRAVPGATGTIGDEGDLVCVTASAPAPLPVITLRARSCALSGGR